MENNIMLFTHCLHVFPWILWAIPSFVDITYNWVFFPVLHVDVYVLHIICVKIYPLVKLFWFVISSFRKKDVYFKDGKNEEGVGTFICILAKK